MDWAMKFLPMKFRERMDDFYGKRGRTWHVTCSIKRASVDEDRVEVDTFVHIFDSCTQDWFSVASIVEHVLSVIKMKDPSITKFFLRSDNAGCYHNTELLLSLKAMGKDTEWSLNAMISLIRNPAKMFATVELRRWKPTCEGG